MMFTFLKGDLAEIIRAGLVLAALALLGPFKEALHQSFGLSDLWASAGGVALVFVGLFIANAVLQTKPTQTVLRNRRLKEFEGLWVQKVGIIDRPYSIAIIKYNKAEGCWTYDGVGFNASFLKSAYWHTSSIYFNDKNKSTPEWFFSGDAKLFEVKDIGLTPEDSVAHVHPILNLPEISRNRFNGIVADVGVGGKRNLFDIELLAAEPQAQINSREDIEKLSPENVKAIIQSAGAIPKPNP
jgi:hypothetical protein